MRRAVQTRYETQDSCTWALPQQKSGETHLLSRFLACGWDEVPETKVDIPAGAYPAGMRDSFQDQQEDDPPERRYTGTQQCSEQKCNAALW